MAQRLLLVDDDPAILEILIFFLAQQGYDLVNAHNGTEALELTRQFQPGLIILDHMMPDMTGLEVCQQLRLNKDISQPQIIMCTAQTQVLDRVRSLLAGADDYISKPIDMIDLLARIRALLHRPINSHPLTAFETNKS